MTNEIYYQRALKLIEKIYDESMYGVNDLYRIKDIIHSFDDNHWKSKQWLVDELYKIYIDLFPTIEEQRLIFIAGGWYGLLAHLLSQKFDNHIIVSSDIDPMAIYYAGAIFSDDNFRLSEENSLKSDAINHSQVVVSTSCEHIEREDLCEWISKKQPDALIALQSNNYFSHQSHINCSDTIDDFVDYVKPCLSKQLILYKGELDLGDFKRFMIIGQ